TFPVKIGPRLTYGGGSRDGFVAKVKPDGTDFEYLGYIGGAGYDDSAAVAVDISGSAYITGATNSDATTLPVLLGPDLTYNGGFIDGLVAKIKSDRAGFEYTGYLGGSGDDTGVGIALHNPRSAYIPRSTPNPPPP